LGACFISQVNQSFKQAKGIAADSVIAVIDVATIEGDAFNLAHARPL
jgi:hypothetical protein